MNNSIWKGPTHFVWTSDMFHMKLQLIRLAVAFKTDKHRFNSVTSAVVYLFHHYCTVRCYRFDDIHSLTHSLKSFFVFSVFFLHICAVLMLLLRFSVFPMPSQYPVVWFITDTVRVVYRRSCSINITTIMWFGSSVVAYTICMRFEYLCARRVHISMFCLCFRFCSLNCSGTCTLAIGGSSGRSCKIMIMQWCTRQWLYIRFETKWASGCGETAKGENIRKCQAPVTHHDYHWNRRSLTNIDENTVYHFHVYKMIKWFIRNHVTIANNEDRDITSFEDISLSFSLSPSFHHFV